MYLHDNHFEIAKAFDSKQEYDVIFFKIHLTVFEFLKKNNIHCTHAPYMT